MCKQFSFLFCICLICSNQTLFAQKLIALHHGGTASFYTTLPDAYNAAMNGDTIYLPGGSFGGITLQKSLTLIGVGHHPDSTSATGQTVLTSSLYIYTGSDNSIISGIWFNSNIYSDGNVSNITIYRCHLQNGIYFNNGTRTNWIISENYIGIYSSSAFYSIYQPAGSSSNFLLTNNVIAKRMQGINSSEISNNIILDNDLLSATNSLIRNNVFGSNVEGYTSNSQWYNNLNAGINGGPGGNGNTGSGNYLDNTPYTSVFTNYNTNNTFYQNDFHVVNLAYLGHDGTPVGIYGGAFPWKEGSLPSNPHIRAKTINSTTNPDGTLHINVTVKAQGN